MCRELDNFVGLRSKMYWKAHFYSIFYNQSIIYPAFSGSSLQMQTLIWCACKEELPPPVFMNLYKKLSTALSPSHLQTSIMAVEYNGGVIVGADSRTSSGLVQPREPIVSCSLGLVQLRERVVSYSFVQFRFSSPA